MVLYDLLYVRCVEEVFLGIVVGGGGDDDEIGIPVCGLAVKRCNKVQGLFGQVFFDVLVLNGRYLPVYLFYFFRDYVHGNNFVMLCQKGGN